MRSPLMLPRLAVVDPELTRDLPPALTAATGMDALTQVIEPYLSVRANPLTDGFCVEGMRRVARSLRRACHDGEDLDARTDMALASLLGGLVARQCRAGGGARVRRADRRALRRAARSRLCRVAACVDAREPGRAARASARCARHLAFTTVAQLLTGRCRRTGRGRPRVAGGLARGPRAFRVVALRHHGGPRRRPGRRGSRASSMRGNCIALDRDELHRVLEAAL